MEDESGFDANMLAVQVAKFSTLYRGLKRFGELLKITHKQISHLFTHYKDFEPNKWVKIGCREEIEVARKEIMSGVENYQNAPDKPQFC